MRTLGLATDARFAMASAHAPDISRYIAEYIDLVDTGIALARAGLRQRLGDEADVDAELREILRRQSEDHQRSIIHMLQELSRRERLAGDRIAGD